MSASLYPLIEPPAQLHRGIVAKVTRLETRRRLLRFFGSFTGFFGCFFALAMVLRWIGQELSQSGFVEFISLIFVDWTVLTRSGRELALALLETLPGLSVSFAGVLCVLGCLSGRSLFKAGRLSMRVRQLSH